ncbi:Rrf2 family transcriptional regulator [bacterium BMS3Abin03]|jgi:Rrf2 family protein|nr:Rrf2 family transcriptional regulator [bacterium BMS3Abin03]MCG6960773.1 Rrf2 family transcriptional regulator [bacterium BMS3Abin03]
MQLTLTGEYAIRAMIHLASGKDDSIFRISEISSTNSIPEKFLRKIIPQLSYAGLINSQRGIGGGIKLGKPASAITPLEIIEAVEGEMALNKCLIDKEFCSNERWCTVHTLWCDAQNKLRTILSSKSIAQLAFENEERKKKLNK